MSKCSHCGQSKDFCSQNADLTLCSALGISADKAKLQAENKILRKDKCLDEILESYAEYNDKIVAENKALKHIGDKLLEEYKRHRLDSCRLGVDEDLIQKAEQQKEKEK